MGTPWFNFQWGNHQGSKKIKSLSKGYEKIISTPWRNGPAILHINVCLNPSSLIFSEQDFYFSIMVEVFFSIMVFRSFFFFFFFFWPFPMWKFLGWGSNPCHSSDNARSLIGTPWIFFWIIFLSSNHIGKVALGWEQRDSDEGNTPWALGIIALWKERYPKFPPFFQVGLQCGFNSVLHFLICFN